MCGRCGDGDGAVLRFDATEAADLREGDLRFGRSHRTPRGRRARHQRRTRLRTCQAAQTVLSQTRGVPPGRRCRIRHRCRRNTIRRQREEEMGTLRRRTAQLGLQIQAAIQPDETKGTTWWRNRTYQPTHRAATTQPKRNKRSKMQGCKRGSDEACTSTRAMEWKRAATPSGRGTKERTNDDWAGNQRTLTT